LIQFFKDFLHQEVPKAGKEIPPYYKRALTISEILLMAYLVVCFFAFPLFHAGWHRAPLFCAIFCGAALWLTRHAGIRANMLAFFLLCVGWVWWNVYGFGWSSGTQHLLTLMLVLVFFNVYEKPWVKIGWFAGALAFRVGLFAWSQSNPGVYELNAGAGTAYQSINTVGFFLILAVLCVIFSNGVQDTERQLRLRNQALYKEAGTDALTGLPNRRDMIETIDRFRQEHPEQIFSVAIADIDFFKKVNDTYGHNCGDYTLVKLTELFVKHAAGRYRVCRWGGEEFCFFIPGRNLDEAGTLMNDLCFAVERMKLEYEGKPFSITITIGVEECDFVSPLEELLDAADEKLYMGKESGRDRVVV
jgi:diguanylate cyclase (GGDEF)-like protein